MTWFIDPLRDVRLTVRALGRSRAFSVVTVLLMALGIGATTTLFSLAYGVLVKPLPWSEPQRLVRLEETRGGSRGRVPWTIANTTYHAWREQPRTIEAIGGWFRGRLAPVAVDGAEPERLHVVGVTLSLFQVLRASPAFGRLFTDDDLGSGGGNGAIVIGFRLWQRRFGGGPNVVGTTIRLDGRPVTIVGVMPRDFSFPDHEAEAWTPFRVPQVIPSADSIPGVIFNAMARLRPGATAEQAMAEATTRARAAPSLRQAGVALFGSSGDINVLAVPAKDALAAAVRPAVLTLLLAAGLLFVTAIASVVVLQSSRAVMRRREMAVRAALGAGPGRLTGLWLLESAVLGAMGGCGGLVLAWLLHRMLPLVLPPDFPRIDDVVIDARAALLAAALTSGASLILGLLPALQSRHSTIATSLGGNNPGQRFDGARARGVRLRTVMLVTQVAIASLLLVGTGLLTRTFVALAAADRGFDARNVLTVDATVQARPFAAQASSLERAQERLGALPGVTDVAFGNALPFVTIGGLRGMTMPSPNDPGTTIQIQTLMRVVSPEYFAAMGLRIVTGRPLDRSDTSTSRPVVVANRTFAAQYLGSSPLGAVIPAAIGSRTDWDVVGVVDDVRQGGLRGIAPSPFGGVTDPPQPELYFAYRQWDAPVSELVYVIRGASNPMALGPTVRAILRDEEPSLAIESIMTMEDRIAESLARPRTYAMLFASFAVFAAVVALVGLFGVLSYMVAQRTREIGLRSALGARPRDIVGLVTREALWTTVCGSAVGLSAAFLLSRWLSTLLYGVSTLDAATFVAAPVLLLTAAAAASAVPARRAARVSPTVALRS